MNRPIKNTSLRCIRRFITAAFNRSRPSAAGVPDDAMGSKTISIALFRNQGWCPICEATATFTAHHSWLRDHYLCDRCGSIPRERALMRTIQARCPDWRNLAIHESSPGNRGASVKLAQQCRFYTASQYDPQLGFGNTHPQAGYRSENLEKQTFHDESFDLVVTQDVFEHVFDTSLAFSEIARTLRPGGAHVFTTPLVNKQKPSEKRASRSDAGIVYHHPPEFHGNPMSAEGSLVTWYWGYDIVDHVRHASGLETEVVALDDPEMGIRAEYIEVMISTRPIREN